MSVCVGVNGCVARSMKAFLQSITITALKLALMAAAILYSICPTEVNAQWTISDFLKKRTILFLYFFVIDYINTINVLYNNQSVEKRLWTWDSCRFLVSRLDSTALFLCLSPLVFWACRAISVFTHTQNNHQVDHNVHQNCVTKHEVEHYQSESV